MTVSILVVIRKSMVSVRRLAVPAGVIVRVKTRVQRRITVAIDA